MKLLVFLSLTLHVFRIQQHRHVVTLMDKFAHANLLRPKERGIKPSKIEDPRSSKAKKHHFQEMLFIALSAILAGAEGFTDMEVFAKSKQSWLVLLS